MEDGRGIAGQKSAKRRDDGKGLAKAPNLCYDFAMKRNTVYEDRAEKEEKRRQRHMEQREKHTVICPHCGKNALDHMTECPHCKGKLTPTGYVPMSEEKMKKVKRIVTVVSVVLTVVIAVMLYFFRK